MQTMTTDQTHTILLIQRSKDKASRTYTDHESVHEAVESLIKMYEKKLQELNPHVRNITYDVHDLHKYLDLMTDLCALTFDPQTKKYAPHDKQWVKNQILNHLRRAAGLL